MGYTHYWERPQHLDKRKFAAFVKDLKRALPDIEAHRVRLAGSHGAGEPEIKGGVVAFNGVEKCGHSSQDLGIAWPAKGAGGVASVRGGVEVAGSWFAGAQLQSRACGGDCAHESFVVERDFKFADGQHSDYGEYQRKRMEENGGLIFEFCKTAFKPYDLAVTVALVILKHHFGDAVRVKSDGDKSEWFDAALLCQTTLGYGLSFKLDQEA